MFSGISLNNSFFSFSACIFQYTNGTMIANKLFQFWFIISFLNPFKRHSDTSRAIITIIFFIKSEHGFREILTFSSFLYSKKIVWNVLICPYLVQQINIII